MSDEPINVTALRERLGLTQQQLAERCGVDRSTVSKWESTPPLKGPALILLRQLCDQVATAAPGDCHRALPSEAAA